MCQQHRNPWISAACVALALVLCAVQPVSTQQQGQRCAIVGRMVRHPNDCGRYYICDNTGWVLFNCPANLAFNGQVCDWPRNVPGCGSSAPSVNTNACNSGPCLNGGTCTADNTVTGYTCTCPFGYSGFNCGTASEPPNPCDPNQCARGACQIDPDAPGGWSCLCPAGFQGPDCSTAQSTQNPCATYPCQNGGGCTLSASSPRGRFCTCPQYYSGEDCSVYTAPSTTTDLCNPNPCLNQGACFVDSSTSPPQPFCSCTVGYTGNRCQTSSSGGVVVGGDACATYPCRNNGVCTLNSNAPNGRTCSCQPGFTGQDCSQQRVVGSGNVVCPLYECPNDVARHYYPDWADLTCTTYYACEFGLLQRRSCPVGQQFDLVTMACQVQSNPSNVFCSSFRAQSPNR